MADLVELQQIMGVSFNDPSLLEQSLRHGSYINELSKTPVASNETMEFLGDAVLGLVIAEKLYHDFPRFTEGEMTHVRAAIVRRDTLARLARTIKLGDFLYLGKGEEASGGRSKPSNLASTLEAVIAAAFLDRGLAVARDFVLKLIDKELERTVSRGAADYKSQLQELIQARQQVTPTYHLVSATGPPHSRTFTVEARVDNKVLGSGMGTSKKLAEMEAARAALEQLATFT
jgi:ribonuclease-3